MFIFVWTFEYIIRKLPVPTKRATVILIKIKSTNALLRMLLECISIYLKNSYEIWFLILDTHHPDALCLHEHGCEDPWLYFEATRGMRAKMFGGNTVLHSFISGKISSYWYRRTTPAGARVFVPAFKTFEPYDRSSQKRPECLVTTEQSDGVPSNFLQSVKL
jgi:hypothetical protein